MSGAALMGGPIYVWASLGALLVVLLRQIADRPDSPERSRKGPLTEQWVARPVARDRRPGRAGVCGVQRAA